MAESLGEAFIEILADTSPFGGSLSDGISEGLSGVEDEIASAFDGVDDAATDAFDGIGDVAAGAAGDVGGAFEGVGDTIASEVSSGVEEAESSLGGFTDALGSMQGALATAAGGAGLEGFARNQQDATLSVQRGADRMGETEDAVRGMIDGITDWTFSSADAAAGMELLNQRGIDNIDTVEGLLPVWDNFADATGGDFVQSMEDGMRALGAFGIPAEEAGDHIDTLTFMTNEVDVPMDRLARQLRNNGDELDEMGLGLDESAGLLAALGAQGMDGRDAVALFGQAVKGSEGDLEGLLSELGITAAEFEEYTGKVQDAEGITERQADQANNLATPMERLGGWVENVAFKFGDMGQMAGMLAAPLGALGPAMFGINQAANVFGKIGPAMGKALGGVAKAFNVLRVAILANPLFLIGALIVGIVAVIWYFRDEIIAGLGAAWDWIRDTAGAVWEWLSEAVSTAVDAVVGFVSGLRDRVVEFFTAMVDFVREHHPLAIAFRLVQEYVPQIVTWIQDMVATVVDTVQGWIDSVVELVTDLWQRWVELVQTIRDAVVETIVELVARVVETVSGWVESIVDFVQDLFARWVALQLAIRDAVVEAITNLVTTVATTVSGWVESIVGFVTDLWQRWVNLVHAIRDAVIAAVAALVANVVATVSGWVSSIVGFVTNLKDRWIRGMTNIRDQVIERVRNLVERVKSIVQEWIRRVIRFVEGLRTDFVGTMRKLVTDAVAKIRELPGKILDRVRNFGTLLLNAGRNLITGLISGIREKIGDIGRAMSDAASAVTRFWPFSPAKEGPLRDHSPEDAGANIIGLMAGGMAANIDQIAAQARAAAEAALIDATGGTLRVDAPGQARGRRPAEVDPAGTRPDGARGEMVVNQTIYTADPRKAAQESIRKLRDAAYLGGEIDPVGEVMRRG